MYSLLRSIFFLFPAEQAHYLAMGLYAFVLRIPLISGVFRSAYRPQQPVSPVSAFGLVFPNPVGLAAGFDKDGKWVNALATLGFGFIEVGTVTPLPQGGNPKPRLFRLKKSRALINRMGFNNEGCDKLVERLQKLGDRDFILGANIGKNKMTPNDKATDDYLYCFRKLHPFVDYFVVNVSSPNTPGLRELQEKEPLKRLLSTLQEENSRMERSRPILLKIAPDLTDGQIREIVEIVAETGIEGVVATNTTIERNGLEEDDSVVEAIGAGGLSGAPVRDISTRVVRQIAAMSNGTVPVIGVGGIFTAADAQEKLEAGATLVQVWTGFIYQGPGIVRRILAKLY